VLSEQREGRQILPQDLPSPRHKPERHERVVPRRIRLADLDERHRSSREPRSEGHEGALVRRRENDGVGVVRQVSWATFPCGVYQHRGLKAAVQVLSYDDVVDEDGGFCGLAVSRLTVATSRS